MPFTTPIFLFLFLPLSLLAYLFIPQKLKNLYLLILSLIFYSWTQLDFLPYILASIILNWLLANLMSLYPARKKWFLVIGILANLFLLIYVKYLPFINFNLKVIANLFGLHISDFPLINMPLGISFFTFFSLSYLLDVYHRKAEKSSLINTSLYLIFFPQILAGPINKYGDFQSQLNDHRLDTAIIPVAITRIIKGLGEKMLLANSFGLLADQIFALNSNLAFGTAWLGIIVYTLQIYFDFAGYSNMTIGIASLFGFKFSENFNLPYVATSITKFWERWHISLTSWLREYVYFALGGNRKGVARTYLNIMLVFIVSGFWHGAGWHYVAWGLWHGLFMILEKWGSTKFVFKSSVFKYLSHLYTLLVVMLGWVIFRAPSLASAYNFILVLIGKRGSISPIYWQNYLSPYMICLIILGTMFALGLKIRLSKHFQFLNIFWLILIFGLSILTVAGSTYNAFIYTKF